MFGKLKPCPVCGGKSPTPDRIREKYPIPALFVVFCKDCNYDGPWGDSPEVAAAHWNDLVRNGPPAMLGKEKP